MQDDLNELLHQVDASSKNHVVFVDGLVMPAHDKELSTCNTWLVSDRTRRRLVIIASMAFRRETNENDDCVLGVEEFFMPPWTLSEYCEAVQHDELFVSVKPQLDACDDRLLRLKSSLETSWCEPSSTLAVAACAICLSTTLQRS